MAKNNVTLHGAKVGKNDEFYTQLTDIEKELKFYRPHFEGKVVYCNCDNYKVSNFFKFFYLNFSFLKLKKLICTSFNGDGCGSYAIYDGESQIVGELQGDGDFRSAECGEFLNESDIVVTNPPFSLFREFMAMLFSHGKDFLVIGNMNAITYKDFFPYIKDNKVWWGCSTSGSARNMWFECPTDYVPEIENANYKVEDGKKYRKVQGIEWYTNLDHDKRHRVLDLYARYNSESNPHYDNYKAVEVGKVADIPMDYDGVMGVPITFLDYHNPQQFEILGITENADYLKDLYVDGCAKYDRPYVNGKRMYSRLLVRRLPSDIQN